MKNLDNMNCEKYFIVDRSNYTPGHGYKIVRKHVNSHEAINFFNRVISTWNGLSPDIVNCDAVEKELHRFVRVDMLAAYLVSIASSVVRPVFCEVLIAIIVVDVCHYFQNLD